MAGMDVEWGPEAEWGSGPRLDEFLLARIAEDERLAAEAPAAPDLAQPDGHASPFDPARVRAECAAKRRIVLSCRELRPDTRILGARPPGMRDFPSRRTTSTNSPRSRWRSWPCPMPATTTTARSGAPDAQWVRQGAAERTRDTPGQGTFAASTSAGRISGGAASRRSAFCISAAAIGPSRWA